MRYAVHLAVLAMSAAFACATPTPYMDGVPIRPESVRTVPGYTPPGTGLPEYMPMPQAPVYPRSPHKRYLPPTPGGGPGIWASDEPRASLAPAPIEVSGVPIWVPDEQAPNDARLCASAVTWAADWDGGRLKLLLAQMKDDERACAIIAAWRTCMRAGIGGEKTSDASIAFSDVVWARYAKQCGQYRETTDSYAFGTDVSIALKHWYQFVLKGERR